MIGSIIGDVIGSVFEFNNIDNENFELFGPKSTFTDDSVLTVATAEVILNGVDISKVLIDEQYDNYVSNTSPKEFIKEGIWRDGKEKKIIRYAKWKQEQLDYIRQIDKPKEFTETPEQRKKVNDMLEKLYKKSKMIPE